MKSTYKIEWTYHAEKELKATIHYLEINWTLNELTSLAFEIEKALKLISINPKIFPLTQHKNGVRRAVINKHNTLFYRTKNNLIEILSFFANRKNPNELKFEK